MVVIVLGRARHTAKIRAKSLIGQKKTVVILAHLCSETAVFSVLLYCLHAYCKLFTGNCSWKQAITRSLLDRLNESNRNQYNACCPNRTLNHRVTCLCALLAGRISYWCGLASMYSMLLLLFFANLKYLYCYGVLYIKDTISLHPFTPSFYFKEWYQNDDIQI
jgi:hypothetical protein